MKCPDCGQPTTVMETRALKKTNKLRRRRRCLTCETRFTTEERVYLKRKLKDMQ